MAQQAEQMDVDEDHMSLKTAGEKTKLIVGAGVGNFLEMFDFTVYSFFAAIIGHVFFNSEDKLISLLISVSVFGVGFVMRPLGSIIIGAYADRHGRKAAMLLTIILMAIGSALIGFAPPYEAIGVFAPLMIVMGRLFQGFSAGGEVGAATTLLMESAERNTRGFFVSWQFFGQGLSTLTGSLLAALLMACLSPEAMESWGWRVPFIFSLLIIPVGLYIRAHIKETYQAPAVEAHEKHPFKELISQHTKQTIIGILVVFPTTVMMYILVFFMPNYLKTVTEIGSSESFLVSSYASVIVIVVTVFAGFFCDRLERRKGAAITVLIVTFISSYFAFHFVQNMHVFLAFYTVSVICMGIMLTLSVLFIMEAFEKRIRATATAVIYAFGVSIFGGTAQMIVTFLLKISDRNIMAPFWYLGVAIVFGVAAYLAFDEQRHEN